MTALVVKKSQPLSACTPMHIPIGKIKIYPAQVLANRMLGGGYYSHCTHSVIMSKDGH